ncbi:hypothetical protein EYF80_058085 [Liparis tanakae]|uniref:Uncharacterized protein n=1 Tax=Liparis tanakae TaxID=230148 RepID=A0A4Z2ESH3_9TELE|nr:hypothetical protein EYF80_058085 [Liparis tanakae]
MFMTLREGSEDIDPTASMRALVEVESTASQEEQLRLTGGGPPRTQHLGRVRCHTGLEIAVSSTGISTQEAEEPGADEEHDLPPTMPPRGVMSYPGPMRHQWKKNNKPDQDDPDEIEFETTVERPHRQPWPTGPRQG